MTIDQVTVGSDPWTPTEHNLMPDLTPPEQIVVLARALYRRGYDDHLAGHVTLRAPDDTLWCNPWYLLWDEFTPDDVIRIDLNGSLVEGRWPPPPGIPLHLALHRARNDVNVAVHNHPRWSTTWADRGEQPPIFDQSGALTGARVAVVRQYEGGVNDFDTAAAAVADIGDAKISLLGGHGVFIVGASVAEVFRLCSTFEWRCRQALAVEGGTVPGQPLRPEIAAATGNGADEYGYPGYWEAAVRQELRSDTSIRPRSYETRGG